MTIQDRRALALRNAGYSGALDDMLFKYYRDAGVSGTALQGLEFNWLGGLGYLGYTLQDRWLQYLRALGYTGALGDMMYAAAGVGDTLLTPKSLFLNSEQGVWYDPSDMSTLFQDSAGTIPVTAVEQPVGRMLDKSGRGNHATQATAGNRPVLSARVNTDVGANFMAATYNPGIGGGYTASLSTDILGPDGLASNVTKYVRTGVGDPNLFSRQSNTYLPGQRTSSLWMYVPSQGVTNFGITTDYSDIETSGVTSTIFDQWVRVSSVTTLALTRSAKDLAIVVNNVSSPTTGFIFYAAQGQEEPGAVATRYQRVTSASVYDTAGFPLYLAANGTTSSMSTASINFTATDKISMWAGVSKFSDMPQIVAELSASAMLNDGSLYIGAGTDGSLLTGYTSLSRGNAVINANQSSYSGVIAAPDTSVISTTHDIAAAISTMRVDGVAKTSGVGTKGTGNFGNYPLYLFARGGSLLPLNGSLYSLVIRGAASNATQLAATETYVNLKTKAY